MRLCPKRDLRLKIDELSSTLGTFKGLQIEIGSIYEKEWEEPVGPTPFRGVGAFRGSDRKLLERYKQFERPLGTKALQAFHNHGHVSTE